MGPPRPPPEDLSCGLSAAGARAVPPAAMNGALNGGLNGSNGHEANGAASAARPPRATRWAS